MDCYEGDNKVDGQHLSNYYVTPPPKFGGNQNRYPKLCLNIRKKMYISMFIVQKVLLDFLLLCVCYRICLKKNPVSNFPKGVLRNCYW
jgi:hypothetical protein